MCLWLMDSHVMHLSSSAGNAQASAVAVAEAVYEALTCNCACEQPTATALAQAAAKAGGDCGGVATALSGRFQCGAALAGHAPGYGGILQAEKLTMPKLSWHCCVHA